MVRKYLGYVVLAVCSLGAGCKKSDPNPTAEAPPSLPVEAVSDGNTFPVPDPAKFQLVAAGVHNASLSLSVNGIVQADVSRTVPVVSLASGRAVEVRARLGDKVEKGQLLMRVRSADIASAYSDYQKAVADEKLAQTQLKRAQLLFNKGAIALRDLEVAEDTENKAKVDVDTAAEHLRVLGANQVDQASGMVDIHAPITGYIIEQNVVNAAGVKTLDNSPNLFTIADLSRVWIICDVYQDDLPQVHLGEFADVRVDAYPGQVFHGRIGDIGPVLDPNLRTAKVRLELPNPGLMRVGMFVRASFHGRKAEPHPVVPATAVLHLHDRDWVYVPDGQKQFKRVPVQAGAVLPDQAQMILTGLSPGQQVVANALEFESTVEQ
jgi:membrane fusion protein, heavy metal efflux system